MDTTLLREVRKLRDLKQRARLATGRGKRYAADVQVFHQDERLCEIVGHDRDAVRRFRQIADRYVVDNRKGW